MESGQEATPNLFGTLLEMFRRSSAADVATHVDVLGERGLRVAEVLGNPSCAHARHVEPGRGRLPQGVRGHVLESEPAAVLPPDVLHVHWVANAHPDRG